MLGAGFQRQRLDLLHGDGDIVEPHRVGAFQRRVGRHDVTELCAVGQGQRLAVAGEKEHQGAVFFRAGSKGQVAQGALERASIGVQEQGYGKAVLFKRCGHFFGVFDRSRQIGPSVGVVADAHHQGVVVFVQVQVSSTLCFNTEAAGSGGRIGNVEKEQEKSEHRHKGRGFPDHESYPVLVGCGEETG